MKNPQKLKNLIQVLQNHLTKDESLLVLFNSPKEKKTVFAMNGESLDLQALLSKGYVNLEGTSKETMSDIKNFIVNACVLLCNQNDHVRDAVINSIIDSNN
jgi:hypothetical protein